MLLGWRGLTRSGSSIGCCALLLLLLRVARSRTAGSVGRRWCGCLHALKVLLQNTNLETGAGRLVAGRCVGGRGSRCRRRRSCRCSTSSACKGRVHRELLLRARRCSTRRRWALDRVDALVDRRRTMGLVVRLLSRGPRARCRSWLLNRRRRAAILRQALCSCCTWGLETVQSGRARDAGCRIASLDVTARNVARPHDGRLWWRR